MEVMVTKRRAGPPPSTQAGYFLPREGKEREREEGERKREDGENQVGHQYSGGRLNILVTESRRDRRDI